MAGLCLSVLPAASCLFDELPGFLSSVGDVGEIRLRRSGDIELRTPAFVRICEGRIGTRLLNGE